MFLIWIIRFWFELESFRENIWVEDSTARELFENTLEEKLMTELVETLKTVIRKV